MKCKNCGAEIANDSNFCEFCGNQVVLEGAGQPVEKSKKGWILWLCIGLGVAIVGSIVFAVAHSKKPQETVVEQDSRVADSIFYSLNAQEAPIVLPETFIINICDNTAKEDGNLLEMCMDNANRQGVFNICAHNILPIVVAKDHVLVNNEIIIEKEDIATKLKDIAKTFLTNPNHAPHLPDRQIKQIDGLGAYAVSMGVISLSTFCSGSQLYKDVESVLLQTIYEIRDEESKAHFGTSFRELTKESESRAIRLAVPLAIVEHDSKTDKDSEQIKTPTDTKVTNSTTGTFKSQEWVDLGLPSGTLWSTKTEIGLYTQDEAINLFGENLPTISELQELKSKCTWRIEGRQFKVIGPNGNYILLSANGSGESHHAYRIGNYGAYWSSSKLPNSSNSGLGFYIDDDYYFLWNYEPSETLSVRLVTRLNKKL